MKTLMLMRHAKSSWKHQGLTDFERPLNHRGKQAAPLMGRMLQARNLTPDHILSSSAERAESTARLIRAQFAPEPSLELQDELYHASPRTIVHFIRGTDDRYDSLLLIAHNPGLEELIYLWTREFIAFPTAAIALFQLGLDRWEELALESSIEYDQLWKPKELDADQIDPTQPQE